MVKTESSKGQNQKRRKVRNEFHFNIQLRTRGSTTKNRKKYRREESKINLKKLKNNYI
jgi:hypothetical protein